MDKLTKEYTISSYETDKYENIRTVTMFNLLQDMADSHAEILNIGNTYCKKNNLAWIGRAYHVKFFSLPKLGDKITIETWPSGKTPFIAIRDFCVKDKNGNIIIAASSQWAMIDTKKLKPILLDKNGISYSICNESAITSSFEKISHPKQTGLTKQIQVRYDDIDINGHVNNCIYPMWAMELFSDNFKRDFILNELEINFKKPAFVNDNIEIKAQTVENNTYIVLIGTQEKECAALKLTFSNRQTLHAK